MISHLDRILQMRKQHEYGKRKDDGTYAFPLQLHQISREAVSALFYDDPEMEVTPDTWLEQTGSFIQQIRNNLEASKLSSEVVSITPTNDPVQSLAFVVQYDKAIEIQNAVVTYILSLSDTFEDTKSR